MDWFTFYPVGTLLFKGAEPMVMGLDHHASTIFPPPAQTIIGALRTAVLDQNGIHYGDYHQGKIPSEILEVIGEAAKPAPFQLIGPVFRSDESTFVPAPYTWFCQKSDRRKKRVRVYKARPIDSGLVKTDGGKLLWVRGGSGDLVTMGGGWIQLEDLYSEREEVSFFKPEQFYGVEQRTGIALSRNRSVREGHIYSYGHIRLLPGISMAFGTDKTLPLFDKGFLKLGAEQRFGRYERRNTPPFTSGSSGEFLAIGPVIGSEQSNRAVIATGKIQYVGGWDLRKGFHKPMKGFFPPGSVFSENIQTNLIQM